MLDNEDTNDGAVAGVPCASGRAGGWSTTGSGCWKHSVDWVGVPIGGPHLGLLWLQMAITLAYDLVFRRGDHRRAPRDL